MPFDVKDYGAIGDGRTDDSPAIAAAIAAASHAGGGVVRFPEGTYRCLGLAGRRRVSLLGEGATLLKGGGGPSSHILELSSTLALPGTPLSGDVEEGATTVSLGSTAGFAPGDQVLLRDGVFSCGSQGRNQELNRVREVSGTAVSLAHRAIGRYAAGRGGELVRLRPVGDLSVEGLAFLIPDGGERMVGGGVFGRLATNVTLRGCSVTGPDDDAGIQFEESAWIMIDGCQVRDGQHCGGLGRGNGIVISESSHHCVVTHCRTENVSENAFETNTRYSTFLNNVDLGSFDDSFNTHGSTCRHIQIRGNLCVGGREAGITVGYSGHVAGDLDVIVADNTVIDPGTHGICVTAPEGRPNLDVLVQGNSIWRPSRSGPGSVGIRIAGSRHVVVVGNRIVGGGPNPAHGILAVRSERVVVRGNHIRNLTGGYGISYTGCESLTVASNTLEDIGSYNVYAAPPGPSTDVVIQDNHADDALVSLQDQDLARNNTWGR